MRFSSLEIWLPKGVFSPAVVELSVPEGSRGDLSVLMSGVIDLGALKSDLRTALRNS